MCLLRHTDASCHALNLSTEPLHAHTHTPTLEFMLSVAGYPLLDNILVPTAAGTSRISSTFSSAASRSFTVTVKDTYQPTWPSAVPLSDTSARVDANMSDAQLLVTYLMVPSAQLDLLANPPVMPALSEVQAGVWLALVLGSRLHNAHAMWVFLQQLSMAD